MIVAPGAADRHSQKAGRNDVRHLSKHFVARTGDILISRVLAQRSQAIEAAGNEIGFVVRVHLVACQLFLHELVVRLVLVETRDYIVPEAVSVRPMRVVLITVRFGEPHHIQPVPPPLLAITRGIQQSVDQMFISLRRLVSHKRIDFFRRRRQAMKVVRDAADQRELIGGRSGFQSGLLQSGQDEGVHGGSDPCLVRHCREAGRRYLFPRLKNPVALLRGLINAKRGHFLFESAGRDSQQKPGDQNHAQLLHHGRHHHIRKPIRLNPHCRPGPRTGRQPRRRTHR